MALVRRLARLFTADMHALIDRLEAPEVVLRQAVREMEAELERQIARAKTLSGEIDTARTRLEALEGTRAELDAELDLSFEAGNEALARKLTRRKLETQRRVAELEASRAALEDELADTEACVASSRDELEARKRRSELLGAPVVASEDAAACVHAADIDADDVEIAFLREKQARGRS